MRLLPLFIAGLVGGVEVIDGVNVLAMRQDHSNYDYFTVRDGTGAADMDSVARDLGIEHIGRVGKLSYSIFRSPKGNGQTIMDRFHSLGLMGKYGVDDFQHDRPREKVPLSQTAETEGFTKQWHLNGLQKGGGLNAKALWDKGITGQGVTVAILDDGVNFHHEDLKANYSPETSYDFDTGTTDPYPRDKFNTHGTPCAGLIAAKRDGKCGSGVAYNANFSAIRLPIKVVSDSQDAIALNFKYQTNAIYSNSWSPGSRLTQNYPLSGVLTDALQHGANHGRDGKGSIFVFASGNSAEFSDNCAFSGYLNSIYTITVGAVDKDDKHIPYSEGCSNLMITAYSSNPRTADIHTTGFRDSNCAERFSGTSAAAPMVSAIIALILSKRPELSWRDIQHLLVRSARMVDPTHKSWRRTHSGRYFSNQYGYGVIDGEKILSFLPNYQPIEKQVILKSQTLVRNATLEPSRLRSKQSYHDHIHITRELLGPNRDMRLEHVVVILNITHQCRSMLQIQLISPYQVVSDIVVPRSQDITTQGFYEYPVMTLAHWDEPAHGVWTLVISNAQSRPTFTGQLVSWSLQLHGRIPTRSPFHKSAHPTILRSIKPESISINVKDEL